MLFIAHVFFPFSQCFGSNPLGFVVKVIIRMQVVLQIQVCIFWFVHQTELFSLCKNLILYSAKFLFPGKRNQIRKKFSPCLHLIREQKLSKFFY